MKRAVLAAVVAALATSVALPANAAAGSTFHGGCGYDTVARDPDSVPTTGTHTYTGVMDVLVELYSASPGDDPVSATVTCTVTVNGLPSSTARFAGTGVVTGAKRVSYRVSENDDVSVCTEIDYTSDDTPTVTECAVETMTMIPPQEITAVVDEVVDGWLGLCPALGDVTTATGHVDCHGRRVTGLPVATPAPECSDGIDNDLDGLTDYPADPYCWGPESDAEGLQVPPAP
jgi:hypothetical protein